MQSQVLMTLLACERPMHKNCACTLCGRLVGGPMPVCLLLVRGSFFVWRDAFAWKEAKVWKFLVKDKGKEKSGNKVFDGGVAMILAREVLGQKLNRRKVGPGDDLQFIRPVRLQCTLPSIVGGEITDIPPGPRANVSDHFACKRTQKCGAAIRSLGW